MRLKLGLFLLPLLSLPLMAQTTAVGTCTPTVPCVQVTTTNSAMTQAGSAILWKCMGSATSCSQAALTAAMAGQSATALCPASTSVWECTSFPQNGTSVTYNDPEQYGSLMNYSTQNAFTGGGPGPVSGIAVFPVPAAPIQTPGQATVTIGPLVTSGNAGPQ